MKNIDNTAIIVVSALGFFLCAGLAAMFHAQHEEVNFSVYLVISLLGGLSFFTAIWRRLKKKRKERGN